MHIADTVGEPVSVNSTSSAATRAIAISCVFNLDATGLTSVAPPIAADLAPVQPGSLAGLPDFTDHREISCPSGSGRPV
jgi:hypothetical protein